MSPMILPGISLSDRPFQASTSPTSQEASSLILRPFPGLQIGSEPSPHPLQMSNRAEYRRSDVFSRRRGFQSCPVLDFSVLDFDHTLGFPGQGRFLPFFIILQLLATHLVAIHSLVFPRGQGRVLLYTRRCCHGAWALYWTRAQQS